MGVGPPRDEESHEVTLELEGKVSQEAFDEYIRRLRKCLADLAELTDPKSGNARLKVRQMKQRIVRRR